MGNSLAEIDSALHIGEEVIPLALGALATFDPPEAGIANTVGGLFNVVVKGIDAASQGQSAGKDLEGTIADVVAALESGLGLTPGTLTQTPAASTS